MKNITFFSLLLACFGLHAQPYQASTTKKFDLIHSELHLEPNWENHHLSGEAILTVKPWFYAQNTLILDAKSFDIAEVRVNKKTVKYQYNLAKLAIELGRSYSRTDTLQVYVKYTAKPDELQSIPQFEELEYKGLYFIDSSRNKPQQIWTEGETEYNSCWFPTLDSPNQKHNQDIYLTVPKHFITLSNGLLLDQKEEANNKRTDHWQQKLPHSVYLTMIAAGDFRKVVDPNYSNFEVSYYVEPKYEKEAIGIFGRTPEMIRYFESLLNLKYPWKKYSQIAVRDYVSGAMENTTATIHGSSVQLDAHQLIDGNDDAVIAHELFHHWFGDLVTAESWANLPLNESFADYSEFLWAAHYEGKDEGAWTNFVGLNQYLEESKEKQVPVIRYHYADMEDMFDSHSYAKGGRILHMLRQTVGDEAFFAALHEYLNKMAFENAEISDLREAFEDVTGEDMNWFFDQWFLRAGHPRLQIEKTYKKGKLSLTFKQKIDSSNTTLYRFPIEIEYGNESSKKRKRFEISEQNQHFELDMEEAPDFVAIDPDGNFLGEIKSEAKDKEWIAMALLSSGPIARFRAFQQIMGEDEENDAYSQKPVYEKKKRELALALLKDPFWRIRELAAYKFLDYDGDDFLDVEKALQSVLKTESKSQVRTAAILAMKNFLNPQNDLLFRQALKDSSYSVQAAALEALLNHDPADAETLVQDMEDIDDVHIFSAVADYKSKKAKPEDYPWFVERISAQDGNELYQSLGIFGAFLIGLPAEYQLKAIPFLKQIAENESIWIGRMAATQNLALLLEHPEAQKAIKEIIAKEKNEQLLRLYKQLPIE
ncbi:M1 family metallopeptidase [Marinilongibacter aquaticus]|uniref:M1 family metallopeptidase n=1 Tax=Marinilongibacter aquaticus TaxID=2975157 RepID=UPI0021BDA2B2|nr:M1 family metallopeptidase [Marinilongibacter aquaticus]UBM60181.1 M1 family metallopeptidase [Marinilongibacter aquaticus]